MDGQDWAAVQRQFELLVALPPDRRRAGLEELGREEPALRSAVEALLQADERADEWLAGVEAALHGPRERRLPVDLDLTGSTVSHFRVDGLLGVGGMGCVYRAYDARLGRPVALKIPLPQFALDPIARERFLQEMRSAARLEHPNVCTVLEVGESGDGGLFMAMPLYPGETLQARLDRVGALPLGKAIDITLQIARGLACAHAEGIVHRDLKPANVMLLPDETVKILDFGLAKVRDLSLTAGEELLGTLAYMAPEQLSGAPVDRRTDLYQLGLLLHAMATGRRPRAADHHSAHPTTLIHETLQGEFTPAVVAEVSGLFRELTRATAEERPASVSLILPRLERLAREATGESVPHVSVPAGAGIIGRRRAGALAAACVALVAVGIAVGLTVRPGLFPATPPAARSLAVLPITLAPGATGDAEIADALHRETISQLSRIKAVDVRDRGAVLRLRESHQPLLSVAEQLDVDRLLRMHYERSAVDAILTVQLADPARDSPMWESRIVGEPGSPRLLAAPGEIAVQVARLLGAEVTAEERTRAAALPTGNPEAYAKFAMGRLLWERRAPGDLGNAVLQLQEAIRLDPGFAQAHATLAQVRLFGSVRWEPQYEDSIRSRIHTALGLDPDLPEGHAALAALHYNQLRYDSALAHGRIALERLPHDAPLHQLLYSIYRRLGRWDDAIGAASAAAALDPENWDYRLSLAFAYFALRNYPEAEKAINAAYLLNGTRTPVLHLKWRLYAAWKGQVDTLRALVSRHPGSEFWPLRFELLAHERNWKEAAAYLQGLPLEARASSQDGLYGRTFLSSIALAYERWGRRQQASAYYDSLAGAADGILRNNPNAHLSRQWLGLALIETGRIEEGLAEVRRVADENPPSRDARDGPGYQATLAEALMRADREAEAIGILRQLANVPFGPTLNELRIDPRWDPLREHPEFQRLIRF